MAVFRRLARAAGSMGTVATELRHQEWVEAGPEPEAVAAWNSALEGLVAVSSTFMQRSRLMMARRSHSLPMASPHFAEGLPVGELRENVTLTTSEPDYAWVNPSRSGPGEPSI